MDWNFASASQKHCCSAFRDNVIPIHSGKAMGGTSSLNFMTYAKGHAMDFDNWHQDGWSHEQIKSYFAKLEDYQIPHTEEEAPFHGQGGPFTVSEPDFKSRAADLFLEAGYEIGHRLVDYNGKNQIGFSYPSTSINDGARMSTNRAYLNDIYKRPNLHLSLNSVVTKIHFDQNLTVSSLTYEKDSVIQLAASAKREVILCAGAINSPKLLMLSGIGPRQMLERFGIPVLVDAPGVGRNLQDHVSVIGLTYHLNQSVTLKPATQETMQYQELWRTCRSGPMTNPMGFEGVAYLSSHRNAHHQWPDIQIKMNSANIWKLYRDHLKLFWKHAFPSELDDTVTFFPTLLRPKSRGRVSLRSADPAEQPIVDPEYLSHPDDIKTLASAIEISYRLARSRAFRRYGSRLFNWGLFPRCNYKIFIASDYYKCIATTMSVGGFSLAGTCKMGSNLDEMAVVDNRLKVIGVNKLRIADASIMPTLISAEAGATCAMIGEKAADMIRRDWLFDMQIFVSYYFLVLCWRMSAACDCITADQSFDYIIVGAGTTGSVVAARLSEHDGHSVLVLEAGDAPSTLSDIPFLSRRVLSTRMNWNYKTEPQKHCCKIQENRILPIIAGRGLGGTSSLDFMLYARGNRNDFDQWQSLGNDGWGYRELLPYFRKLEDYRVPRSVDQDEYHGQNGPIAIDRPRYRSPMTDAFLRAGHQLGHHLVDINGHRQTGFMNPPFFMRDGQRCSSYNGYLEPAIKRNNIRVLLNVLVTKILFDDHRRAVGVLYRTADNQTCEVRARKEIVLSAGVFNTPQLLMLSGIGPAKTLRKHKIPVVKHVPGVGQNLQDHVTIDGLTFYINQSVSINYERFSDSDNLDLWRKSKTGPLTCSSSFEGIAFHRSKRSNHSEDWPDIQILFRSDNVFEHDTTNLPAYALGYLPPDSSDVITFYPILLRPKSRGRITIGSSDPMRAPLIDPNYLSHPDDVQVLLEGWRFAWKIARTHSFAKYGTEIYNWGLFPRCLMYLFSKSRYENCVVRTMAYTAHSHVGTCKMGPTRDRMAVVDDQLRVRGIEGLRIADASIMPTVVSGQPRTVCIVVGEKLADLLKVTT
uniref:Glucose-methanol-choline oxidoreductase N-terminal domain-containing protein n=1 Tax=Strigamia maritima TaxID=126957 RepID=T1J9D4_STRMM